MKIAFISYFSGINRRGAETYVHELSNQLVSLKHEVTVFQSGDRLLNSKYKVIQLKKPLSQFNSQVFSLIPLDTQIVIPTNGRLQAVHAKIWSVTRSHSKIIISGQSGPGLDDRINLFTFPSCFVSLTSFQRLWAKGVNPLVKTVIIPNGVNLDVFTPKKAQLDFGLPGPLVLYTAALEPIKRHELLIKAVSQTPASLILVGNGSLKSHIEQLCRAYLPNRFTIISYPHSQMPQVYSSVDLFVYPTYSYESFGIAILEALASGLSVVATDDPIRREIIGKAGWYVDPENISAFSQILKQALIIRPHISPRVQAEKFSWNSVALKYQDLFFSLIS